MTNELARYRNLLAVRADKTFDVSASEIALARRFSEQPIVEIVTGAGRPFFVRRHCERQAAPAKMYRVFGDARSAKEERGAIGFCRIIGPVDGLGRISNAGVSPPFQRHGIASAVYDLIATDLASVGALLWPASPADMGDAEFKIWWRRASALVFYYPHRQRLGFAAAGRVRVSAGRWRRNAADADHRRRDRTEATSSEACSCRVVADPAVCGQARLTPLLRLEFPDIVGWLHPYNASADDIRHRSPKLTRPAR